MIASSDFFDQSTIAALLDRINSQAQTLGIERPKVRNGHSVENLNTWIYLIINVRALVKAKSISKGLLQRSGRSAGQLLEAKAPDWLREGEL